jgi:glycosyltransferase involved in cell wall biosynthesis
VRVAWFSHSSEVGGAELALLEGAHALICEGVHVHAVVPGNGPLVQRLEEAGARVAVVRYDAWVFRRNVIRRAWRMARLSRELVSARRCAVELARVGADIAVTNTLTFPAAALGARRAAVPHVWYVHEFGEADHELRFALGDRFSFGLIDRLSDVVVANSAAIAAHLRTRGVEDVRIVPYAVELPSEVPVRPSPIEDTVLLVQVASVTPGKGQEDSVRALAALRAQGIRARLEFVGKRDPDYETRLRELANHLSVEPAIGWHGFVDDPRRHVARADVVLVCSRSEAFGRATVEAMKLGKPVVGARTGGTAELISDGETGLLYAPGNPVSLAEAIARLVQDAELRSGVAERARRWANDTFTSARFGQELLELFDEVLTRRGVGRSSGRGV